MEFSEASQRRMHMLQSHLCPSAPSTAGDDAPPMLAPRAVAGEAGHGAARRAVIVAGARTPFVKSFGEFLQVRASACNPLEFAYL